jgi:hypothetical protein
MKTFLILLKMACLVGGGALAAFSLALEDNVAAGTWPSRIEWVGNIIPAVGAVIATNLYAFLSNSWAAYRNGADKQEPLAEIPKPPADPESK